MANPTKHETSYWRCGSDRCKRRHRTKRTALKCPMRRPSKQKIVRLNAQEKRSLYLDVLLDGMSYYQAGKKYGISRDRAQGITRRYFDNEHPSEAKWLEGKYIPTLSEMRVVVEDYYHEIMPSCMGGAKPVVWEHKRDG